MLFCRDCRHLLLGVLHHLKYTVILAVAQTQNECSVFSVLWVSPVTARGVHMTAVYSANCAAKALTLQECGTGVTNL